MRLRQQTNSRATKSLSPIKFLPGPHGATIPPSHLPLLPLRRPLDTSPDAVSRRQIR